MSHPEDRLYRCGSVLRSVGRYGLRSPIGAGLSGTVFAAYDPEEGREVAINLMRVAAGAGEKGRAEILAIARSWARLRHPNVVAIHEVGTFTDPLEPHHGGVFVVREMTSGVDLQRWLDARDHTGASGSAKAVLDVFIAAGRGLAAAHAAGLVHGDFRPASVIVGYDGRVRLLDFATSLARPLVSHELESRPAYPAPEVRAGAAADARADQYSFCAALDDALRPAFGGRLPRQLERVIARGMSDEPAARWPSLDDVLRGLEHARRGRLARTWATALTTIGRLSVAPRHRIGFAGAR